MNVAYSDSSGQGLGMGLYSYSYSRGHLADGLSCLVDPEIHMPRRGQETLQEY